MRTFPQFGYEFVEHWEGCKLKIYYDGGGRATVGIGHLVRPGEDFSAGITEEQAIFMLKQDLAHAQQVVENLVQVPLSDNAYVALVDFVFNLGEGNFAASTLLKLINSGNDSQVQYEFPKWCHDHGVVVQGLKLRRQAEARLYMTPDGCIQQP